jgi:hypothetical protein
MIAELFWPKEMRELVAKLRAEDKLNEQALKSYNGTVYISLFVFVLCSVLLFDSSNLLALILVIIFVIAFYWTIRHEFKKSWQPYTRGECLKAKVTMSGENRSFWVYPRIQKVYAVLVSNSKVGVVINAYIDAGYREGELPDCGEVMGVWVDSATEYAMPDIDYIKRKYCLDKTKLDDAA